MHRHNFYFIRDLATWIACESHQIFRNYELTTWIAIRESPDQCALTNSKILYHTAIKYLGLLVDNTIDHQLHIQQTMAYKDCSISKFPHQVTHDERGTVFCSWFMWWGNLLIEQPSYVDKLTPKIIAIWQNIYNYSNIENDYKHIVQIQSSLFAHRLQACKISMNLCKKLY